MRIIFMGSPEFSVPTLSALIDSGHEIVAVYSQPPRPAGRGKALRLTPVHERALAAGLQVRTPLNFKDSRDVAEFSAFKADLAVVIAYGLILPKSLLGAPQFGCVNLHASLLPRWRGAAPIHRAIMAGDEKSGVCLMQMEEGLDTGPILAKAEIPLNPSMTTGDLHDILAMLSATLLLENIGVIASLEPLSQSEAGIVYAEKISKAEAAIDWTCPADDIQRQIHALSPFPGAWSELESERIKFHRVRTVAAHGLPGTVIDVNFTIACGQDAILPIEIQRAGKRMMPIDEALRGMDNPNGKRFRENE